MEGVGSTNKPLEQKRPLDNLGKVKLFGELLNKARSKMGDTRENVAYRLGVSVNFLYKCETQDFIPKNLPPGMAEVYEIPEKDFMETYRISREADEALHPEKYKQPKQKIKKISDTDVFGGGATRPRIGRRR